MDGQKNGDSGRVRILEERERFLEGLGGKVEHHRRNDTVRRMSEWAMKKPPSQIPLIIIDTYKGSSMGSDAVLRLRYLHDYVDCLNEVIIQELFAAQLV